MVEGTCELQLRRRYVPEGLVAKGNDRNDINSDRLLGDLHTMLIDVPWNESHLLLLLLDRGKLMFR